MIFWGHFYEAAQRPKRFFTSTLEPDSVVTTTDDFEVDDTTTTDQLYQEN